MVEDMCHEIRRAEACVVRARRFTPHHTRSHQLEYTLHLMSVFHTTCYVIHTQHNHVHTNYTSHPMSVCVCERTDVLGLQSTPDRKIKHIVGTNQSEHTVCVCTVLLFDHSQTTIFSTKNWLDEKNKRCLCTPPQ